MTDSPNVLSPRQLAVAVISEQITTISSRIDAHRQHQRDGDALFHSQIIVFLEQMRHELKRAAHFLEFHDASEE